MVHVAASGTVYAFIVGTGLVRASEPGLGWQTISNGFGKAFLLHLAVAQSDSGAAFAVAFDPESRAQSLHASRDGGRSWSSLGGK